MVHPDGVNVIGYFHSLLGNGETARLIASSLAKNNIPHTCISADFLASRRAQDISLQHCEKEPKFSTNLFCIDIMYVLPFLQKFGIDFLQNRRNILLFFWETNMIPEDRSKLFSYFDEVWVASRYNQESVLAATNIPVSLIPHPLHLKYFSSGVGKSAFGLHDKFTFLFCFDFFSNVLRKNPQAVIQAFQKAFPARDDVQLVIKSQNGLHFPHRIKPEDPRIIWIDESMDQQRRYDLMSACDCYVSLHRSEGFGLTMAEAMLLDKPVIATGYSGNLDFMTTDNSYLCGYKLIPVGSGQYPYPSQSVWAEVNTDEAAFWMQHVVDHPAEAREKARQGKKELSQNYALDRVGTCITDLLRVNRNPLKQKRIRLSFWQDLAKYYVKGAVRRARKLLQS